MYETPELDEDAFVRTHEIRVHEGDEAWEGMRAAGKLVGEALDIVLEAEAEIEQDRAREDADAAMMLQAYLKGWKLRKGAAEADVEVIDAEEEGARDALTGAFEELKKFEHVAETTRLNAIIAAGKRETAAFDELGLRRRSA